MNPQFAIIALLLSFVSVLHALSSTTGEPNQLIGDYAYVPSLIEYPLHFGDKSLVCMSMPPTLRTTSDVKMSFKPADASQSVAVKILRMMDAHEIWRLHWYHHVYPDSKNGSALVQAGSECLQQWLKEGRRMDRMRLIMFQLPTVQEGKSVFGKYGLDVAVRHRRGWRNFWKQSWQSVHIEQAENQQQLMPNHSGFQIVGPQIEWRNPRSLDVVVAYFKEDLSWMQILPQQANIFAYYKGGQQPKIPKRFHSTSVPLPNEGRESHTFLYHVIHNYNHLADYTYFTLASVDPTEFKRQNFNHVIAGLKEIAAGLDTDTIVCRSIANERAGFRIGGWEGATEANGKATGFTNADVYPFGTWYKTFVNDTAHEVNGPFDHPCFTGMMIVPRSSIVNKPLQYYKRLIATIEGKVNPEEGHFFERAWGGIFGQ